MDNEKEKQKGKDKSGIIILILYIVFAVSAIIFSVLFYFNTENSPIRTPRLSELIALVSFFAISIPISISYYISEQRAESAICQYEEYLSGRLGRKNDSKIGESEKKNIVNRDAIEEMIKNNREIAEYFKISKRQEKISYGISIFCSIIGVFMLLSSVIAIGLNEEIEPTIIKIIGGTITEFVSGIVLWIHNKSLEQLNYYYKSLHENEKFLSAINLADKLGDTEKKQMYMEIIKAQVSVKRDVEEKEENN